MNPPHRLPIWLLLGAAGIAQAAGLELTSNARPLPPEFTIHRDGSVTLRVCFNWSCSKTDTLTFQGRDIAKVTEQMNRCTGSSVTERIQRVRVGIWQMQLVAQRFLPILKNDREINEFDRDLPGRLDCVDSATNTGTYLNVLADLGLLEGWRLAAPEVRDVVDPQAVHWTAVLVDRETGENWSVDSWFRPHGHLPFMMPLKPWTKSDKAWEPPFARFNPYPTYINDLCAGAGPPEEEADPAAGPEPPGAAKETPASGPIGSDAAPTRIEEQLF